MIMESEAANAAQTALFTARQQDAHLVVQAVEIARTSAEALVTQNQQEAEALLRRAIAEAGAEVDTARAAAAHTNMQANAWLAMAEERAGAAGVQAEEHVARASAEVDRVNAEAAARAAAHAEQDRVRSVEAAQMQAELAAVAATRSAETDSLERARLQAVASNTDVQNLRTSLAWSEARCTEISNSAEQMIQRLQGQFGLLQSEFSSALSEQMADRDAAFAAARNEAATAREQNEYLESRLRSLLTVPPNLEGPPLSPITHRPESPTRFVGMDAVGVG